MVTQQVILGNGSAGTRYLMVVVDPEQRTIDPDRSNNTRVAVVPTVVHAADLRVSGLETTNVVELGGGLVVRWRTTNPGGSDTTAPGRDAVFLSPSADSLAGAVLLGSFAGTPVTTGGGYDRTVTVTVPLRPDQIAVGPAFLVVVADVDNAQPEADEGNNRASVPVTVVAPPLPDLTVDNVEVPQFSGGGVETELRWTVRNAGTAPIAGAWDERWVMQVPGASPLTLSAFRFTNSLPAGGSISRTQFVVLPPNLTAGAYTMTAAVDPGFEVIEANVANNAGTSTTRLVIPAALTLEGAEFSLVEGAPAQMFRVLRNSDSSVPLTVVLTNPLPSEIELPESVLIPAGQSVAEFPVKALVDGVTDGARLVMIEASAPGHAAAPLAVPTEDIDRPRLTIETTPDRVLEGRTLPVTLRRSGPIGSDALVLLRSTDSTRITLPTEVTIPAGSALISFAALTVDDNVLQLPAAVDLVAISGGYVGATNRITVDDDDIPQVTATVSAAELNEAAGPQAGYVTFRRTGSLDRALVMDLVVTVDDLLLVAPTATFEAGSDSVTVSIGVVNDTLLNGRRQAALRVFLRATGRLDTVAETAPVELAVIDDEGPTLTLSLGSDVAGEGRNPAFSGTVRRNTGTNTALTVTLRSADVTEATVPATVVIPVGAASVTFPVATVDDAVADGSQTVAIEASAVGFTGSTVSFVVSDTSLPDLSVTRVQVPVTGDSESTFNVTYRVENRGNIATDKGFVTRVLLSADPVPGGDTLLGQYFFEGSIPKGQFFEQTSQFRLPRQTGRFWVIVVTDATGVVGELREDNNTTVATVPIEVKPSYIATVSTDVDQAMPGTPVPLRGRAVRAGSEQGVPNVVVNVHVEVRGTRRIVTALTDSTGAFEAVFRPLPNEAGRYTVGAAHPGEASAAVQDRFSLIGFAAEPKELAVEMSVGGFDIVVVDLVNLSEVPLTGMRVEPVALPSHLGVQATLNLATLGGDSTNSMIVRVEATGAATTFGKFGLKVTSNEGSRGGDSGDVFDPGSAAVGRGASRFAGGGDGAWAPDGGGLRRGEPGCGGHGTDGSVVAGLSVGGSCRGESDSGHPAWRDEPRDVAADAAGGSGVGRVCGCDGSQLRNGGSESAVRVPRVVGRQGDTAGAGGRRVHLLRRGKSARDERDGGGAGPVVARRGDEWRDGCARGVRAAGHSGGVLRGGDQRGQTHQRTPEPVGGGGPDQPGHGIPLEADGGVQLDGRADGDRGPDVDRHRDLVRDGRAGTGGDGGTVVHRPAGFHGGRDAGGHCDLQPWLDRGAGRQHRI